MIMKKILMLVTMLGLIHDNITAQTKKIRTSSFNNNYSICHDLTGYFVCSSKQLHTQNEKYEAITTPREIHSQAVNMESSTMLNNMPDYSSGISYRYHNFMIGDDRMDNPANGIPSQQYDGPAKNAERNINYNQTSVSLKSSDGK